MFGLKKSYLSIVQQIFCQEMEVSIELWILFQFFDKYAKIQVSMEISTPCQKVCWDFLRLCWEKVTFIIIHLQLLFQQTWKPQLICNHNWWKTRNRKSESNRKWQYVWKVQSTWFQSLWNLITHYTHHVLFEFGALFDRSVKPDLMGLGGMSKRLPLSNNVWCRLGFGNKSIIFIYYIWSLCYYKFWLVCKKNPDWINSNLVRQEKRVPLTW